MQGSGSFLIKLCYFYCNGAESTGVSTRMVDCGLTCVTHITQISSCYYSTCSGHIVLSSYCNGPFLMFRVLIAKNETANGTVSEMIVRSIVL